ncbi:hypothetical protein ACFLTP_04525 [Chloroflexota bacterium]
MFGTTVLKFGRDRVAAGIMVSLDAERHEITSWFRRKHRSKYRALKPLDNAVAGALLERKKE